MFNISIRKLLEGQFEKTLPAWSEAVLLGRGMVFPVYF